MVSFKSLCWFRTPGGYQWKGADLGVLRVLKLLPSASYRDIKWVASFSVADEQQNQDQSLGLDAQGSGSVLYPVDRCAQLCACG